MATNSDSDVDKLIKAILGSRSVLIAYARAIVRDEHLAEDVFQDAVAIMLRKQDEVDSIDNPLAWARTIIRYQGLNVIRKAGRHEIQLAPEVLDKLDATWSQFTFERDSVVICALDRCLEQLSTKNRDLLRLRYTVGLKPGEIAAQLNKKPNTIYTAFARTHAFLAECMKASVPQTWRR